MSITSAHAIADAACVECLAPTLALMEEAASADREADCCKTAAGAEAMEEEAASADLDADLDTMASVIAAAATGTRAELLLLLLHPGAAEEFELDDE